MRRVGSALLSRLPRGPASAPARALSTKPVFPAVKLLESIGLPGSDAYDFPESKARFPDGGQYRIEIPSTEGVASFKAVLEESKKHNVTVHRVSQGTGIFLLPERELLDMLRIGKDNNIEVCLFVGPRSAWDTSATARTDGGKNISGHKGSDQFAAALEDVRWAVDKGLRSILVADLGLMYAIGKLVKAGKLPSNLVSKVSVLIGPMNPASALILDSLGASSLNAPTDLSIPQLASIRSVTNTPLDMYVEVPDDLGGYVRHYEVPKLVYSCSPLYIKLGLRNAPNIYPSGTHIEHTAVALSRERVRRARICLDILNRYYPTAVMSPPGGADLGIPEI